MHATISILALALAGAVIAAPSSLNKRHLNQVTVWSDENCGGSSTFASTEVSSDFCFEGLGGASFDQFGSTCGQGGGFVRTWSGGNCLGSSQDFSFPQGCQTIPFASIELFCFE